MSGFQARFDSHIAVANSAAANNTVALQEHPIKMHPAHVRRLLASISKLLGLVDGNQARHPEYLAATPTMVPEKAIELAASVKPSFDAGVEHFIQNTLPQLVDVEDRLNRAVGAAEFKIAEIKNQQVRSLKQIIDRANFSKGTLDSLLEEAKKEKSELFGSADEVAKAVLSVSASQKKVSEVAALAAKLANGHARQGSLESLVRDARSKSDEIDTLLVSITVSKDVAEQAAEHAKGSSGRAEDELSGLSLSNEKAVEILNNATQAGLAGAYKTEREKLKKQQDIFGYIFYGVIVAIIVYAAIFLIPIARDLLVPSDKRGIASAENAEILLVRLLILTPAIWALIFTNRRYANLESLQMDYAAKASTALAYSGYRDEMNDDAELSKRLKDGLLIRFLEHPSRLLKNGIKDDVFEHLRTSTNNEKKTAAKGNDTVAHALDVDEE
jgi:hypothetical protein